MKVTTERQENSIVKMTISVEDERTDNLMQRAARTISRDYRVPGFRPGKAPYNVVVRRFGIDAVRSQVLEQFGDEIFHEGLDQSGLAPIDQASLEEVTWEPFTLHLKVPVGPEVDLDVYRDIRVPWEEPQVTDQQLDEALLRLQKEQTEWRPDQRPAELGDHVVLDVTATVEGEVVLENTGREMILNAESPFPVPGFAEQVVGMQPGETKEFELSYPEDHYNADIAGKLAHLTVKLNEIRVEILPMLDDEFAMSVGDYESLEDLKTKLRQSLQEEAAKKAEDEYEEKVWQALSEKVSVEYPQVLVDRETEAIRRQLEQQLQQQNLDLATYFRLTNTTEEAWKEQVRPQAEERLKRRLILSKVVEVENIQLDPAEIDAEVERVVEPLGERADDLRKMLLSDEGKATVADGLITRKAVQYLIDIARGKITEQETAAPPTEAEASAEAQEPGSAQQVPAEETAESTASTEKEADTIASATTEEEQSALGETPGEQE